MEEIQIIKLAIALAALMISIVAFVISLYAYRRAKRTFDESRKRV